MKLSGRYVDRLRALLGYRFPPLGRTAFSLFFRSIPQHMDVQLFPGITVPLDFRDETQRSTYWQGSRFEHPLAPFLARHGDAGTAFFDIGANYGFFSYWMLSRCPQVQVYAFDPVPANITCMEHVRSRCELESRFHVMGHALGKVQEVRRLRLGNADSGHSTFGAHPGLNGDSLGVEILPFDLWRQRAGLTVPDRPEWVAKIDVEGFELNVLQGMEDALRRRAFRALAVEINDYTLGLFGVKSREVFDFLEQCGYVAMGSKDGNGVLPGSCCNAFFVPSELGA